MAKIGEIYGSYHLLVILHLRSCGIMWCVMLPVFCHLFPCFVDSVARKSISELRELSELFYINYPTIQMSSLSLTVDWTLWDSLYLVLVLVYPQMWMNVRQVTHLVLRMLIVSIHQDCFCVYAERASLEMVKLAVNQVRLYEVAILPCCWCLLSNLNFRNNQRDELWIYV